MNAPSCITGILDEYCWAHEHPYGGWTCEICWREIRLADFFADVAKIAKDEVGDRMTCYTYRTNAYGAICMAPGEQVAYLHDTGHARIAHWLHDGHITVGESARMVDDLVLGKVLSGDTCPTPTTCQEFSCMGHCERVAIGESEVHHAS